MGNPVGFFVVAPSLKIKDGTVWNGRRCGHFYCTAWEDSVCCADCPLDIKMECKCSCLNDPSRCALEDK